MEKIVTYKFTHNEVKLLIMEHLKKSNISVINADYKVSNEDGSIFVTINKDNND